ncbi:WbqC family protein [Sediminibacterium ginsengisoli]|uniref:WbqC-like protein family protein n=1 Tax=Sediminibacterium ginsengisoli TaxID=413434 RepID=A0A1T4R8R9_9BACT|nr:WbqC family protein [Sediminibacterium ginsengisoli]SKA12422.1 WbqC-like protein family protein [Sediminibacterium ginsengisoli]
MSIEIIEIQYFPTINYSKILFFGTNNGIILSEEYRKMSFRNRCVVAGSNGLIHLSVPLEKGRTQKIPTAEVRISYSQDWQQQHWRTIVSCYNRSPFFEFYAPWLEDFFRKKHEYLADMNQEILEWLARQLKILLPAKTVRPEDAAHAIDRRDYFLPKNFQQDDRKGDIFYTQVFADRIGFQPNLSILDLLFCEGPASSGLLQGSKFSF